MGTKRTQACPLCKKQTNQRSLLRSETLRVILAKTKHLEEVFIKESTRKDLDNNNCLNNQNEKNKENEFLEPIPLNNLTKRKRNSSVVG